jgi:cellulose synthase/poly-beta-1,6-N-acetylglucosamine synthase-like glycosyltransferase
MTLLYPTLLVLSLLYFLFMDWCWLGWLRLKTLNALNIQENTFATIIIPARNEELTIERCLHDLILQQYPSHLFEIIVVNDHSTDDTAAKVAAFIRNHQENYSIRLININKTEGNQYKKLAITSAINAANGNLIITTDADCRRNENWLKSIVAYYEQHSPAMLCGPVAFDCNNSFFQKIQSLEFCGLVAISGGSIAMNKPLMCNGANLAFTKEMFHKVNGYDSENNAATGDDTLLMKKIAEAAPGGIHFLKSNDAIVYTRPSAQLSDLFQQRKRWASKIPVNMGALTVAVAAVAWLLHASLIIALLLSIAGVIPLSYFLIPFAIKITGEFLLLFSSTRFLKKQRQLWLLLPAEFIYLFYIVIVGIASLFGTYRWKNRNVKV